MPAWPAYTQNLFRGVNELDDMRIANEEASSSKRCLLDEIGSLRSGDGRAIRNVTAIAGTPNVLDLHRFYLSDGETMKFLAGTGASLWLGNETSPFAFTTELKGSLDATAKGRYQTFKDKVFRVNGVNSNLKYDGTDLVTMGVEIPNAPVVAVAAGGVLDGDYYYKVSYLVDGYSEGNASVASALVQPTGANKKVLVTKPTSTPEADVTHWIIYRTTDAGAIYYKVAQVAIGTATYLDNIADTDLDTATLAPTDNAAPSVADYIALHHRYIFLAKKDTSRIYFCKQDYPEWYPAAYFFDINPKDGENLSGIITALGAVYAFKPNGIYAICGNDVDDFGVPPQKWSKRGCYAPDTLDICNWQGQESIIYLHKTGIRVWNGTTSELVSRKIQPTIDSILSDYIDIACGAVIGNEYWISFCTSGTANNETWILNLLTGDWRKNDYGVNALCAWVDGRLFSGIDAGWVREEKTGTDDLGENISWEYKTKNYSWPHDFGELNKYREFVIWASLATDTLRITFTVDNDSTNKEWYEDLVALGATIVKTTISLPKELLGELIMITYSSTGKNRTEIRKTVLKRIPTPGRK